MLLGRCNELPRAFLGIYIGLPKNCFKIDLELDLFCARARELFVSHEKTSMCLLVAVFYNSRRTN